MTEQQILIAAIVGLIVLVLFVRGYFRMDQRVIRRHVQSRRDAFSELRAYITTHHPGLASRIGTMSAYDAACVICREFNLEEPRQDALVSVDSQRILKGVRERDVIGWPVPGRSSAGIMSANKDNATFRATPDVSGDGCSAGDGCSE